MDAFETGLGARPITLPAKPESPFDLGIPYSNVASFAYECVRPEMRCRKRGGAQSPSPYFSTVNRVFTSEESCELHCRMHR